MIKLSLFQYELDPVQALNAQEHEKNNINMTSNKSALSQFSNKW